MVSDGSDCRQTNFLCGWSALLPMAKAAQAQSHLSLRCTGYENEGFSKFNPQESKPEEYTPAPLGVPEGNL